MDSTFDKADDDEADDDEAVDDDNDTRSFSYLKTLGEEQASVSDVKKNKALRNAGGFYVSCFCVL